MFIKVSAKRLSVNMIQFRQATLNDINTLVDLRIEFLHEVEKPISRNSSLLLKESLSQFFKEKIAKNEFISWLATSEENIIATSGVSFLEIPPSFANISGKEAYIMNMYTLSQFRKRGIGTQLLECIIEEVKKRKIPKISLHATEKGKPIYTKRGFKESGSEMVLFID